MKAIDPVYGHTVETEETDLRSEHVGNTYYFCEPACKVAFDKAPEKHALKKKAGK